MYYYNNKLYYGYGVMLPNEKEVARRIHSIDIEVIGIETDWETVSSSLMPNGDGKFNTYGDFHLIPSQMPFVSSKEPLTSYVTVPGSKYGGIDMTTALTGDVLYKDREGTWTFMYENTWRHGCDEHTGSQRNITIDGVQYTASGFLTPFQIQKNLEKYIHGRMVYVYLMDDPNTRYMGRVWVDSMMPGESSAGIVTLKYKFKPDPFIITT